MLKLKKSLIIEYCYDIVLLIFFVSAFAYMPTARTSDRTVWVVATLLLVVVTFFSSFQRKGFVVVDKSIKWYLAFVLWGGVSCIWSLNSSQFAQYFIYTFSVVICTIFCLGRFIHTQQDVDRISYLIIIAGCVAAARFTYYTPWDSILNSGYYMRGTFGSLLDDVTNYNNYTSHLCIICVIAAYYAIVKKKKACWIAFIFLFAILIFGGSRKNIIVIPAVALFFSLTQGNVKSKVKTLVMIVSIIVIAMYGLFTLDFLSQIRDRLMDMFTGIGLLSTVGASIDQSTKERLYLIESAKSVWISSPLWGVGWDNFRYYNSLKLYAHNNYWELLASLGLIGFIVFYSYYLKIFYSIIRTVKIKLYKDANIFISGILIAFLIMDYGSLTMYSRVNMILLLYIFLAYSIMTQKKMTHVIM